MQANSTSRCTLANRLLLCLFVFSPLFLSCLNPNFVNSNVGGLYPTAPGDQPFLVVRIINDTTASLDIPIGYDNGIRPLPNPIRISGLTPQAHDSGVVLDWPVFGMGIGDISAGDPFVALTPSVVARLPDGTTLNIAPSLPVLKPNVNFFQGDAIIYRFTADSSRPALITVSVGRIDGSTQTGPFSRADTFAVLNQVVRIPAP